MTDIVTPPGTANRRARLTREQKHSLTAIGLGNLIEWFDWTVYSTFSVYIAANYFSDAHPASALLAALAVFAAGFIARPFGGLLIGWISDRRGRKFAMTLCVVIMPVASLVIAISPSYHSIGVWASAILVVARLAQGISQGGETPASFTILGEVSPPSQRGLWSSLIYVSGTAGILLTTGLSLVLHWALSDAQMQDFGWRIAFGVGALLGVYTLWMRRTMPESEVYETEKAKGNAGGPGILRNAIRYWRELITVVGLTVGFTTFYYAWVVNMPTYANVTLGYSSETTLWAGSVAYLLLMAALPFWGMLSDRIGRKKVLIISFASMLVLYLPAQLFLGQSTLALFICLGLMFVLMGGVPAIFPATLSEMLPTKVRASGIGFPYAFAVALFGGTAPYLQQWASGLPGFNFFPIYVMALVLVSLIVSFIIPETKGKPMLD